MIIKSKNLQVSKNNKLVLKNINFSFNYGDFICIVGDNGSGKTTLIKTLLQLNSDYKGELSIADDIYQNIAYISQDNSISQISPATVKEIVKSGLIKNRSILYPKNWKEDLNESLNFLGILDLKDKQFNKLSGGQKQRVLLARAIISKKPILVCDEPTQNLDEKTSKKFIKLLERLNQEKGLSILMATHDMRGLENSNTKIIDLNKVNK